MGTLRFILALSVVIAHAGLPTALGNARLAVQIFYVISGFLISFVLHKDDAYANVWRFYLNRALRLYPVYWTVAAATLALWLCFSDRAFQFSQLALAAKVSLIASNIAIFGQDWIMFLKESGASLGFALSRGSDPAALFHFLVVPQAWSLGVEITFYLIAPFIVRRPKLVFGLALGSFTMTIIGWLVGLDTDPWTYRFFPFELSLFLCGALAERHLLPIARQLDEKLLVAAPVAAIALFAAYPYIPIIEPLRSALIIGLATCLLPMLFLFQNGRRWDVIVGDTSYPLYICHVTVIWSLRAVWPFDVGSAFVFATVLLSCGTALMLQRFVTAPVEKIRDRLRAPGALARVPNHPYQTAVATRRQAWVVPSPV